MARSLFLCVSLYFKKAERNACVVAGQAIGSLGGNDAEEPESASYIIVDQLLVVAPGIHPYILQAPGFAKGSGPCYNRLYVVPAFKIRVRNDTVQVYRRVFTLFTPDKRVFEGDGKDAGHLVAGHNFPLAAFGNFPVYKRRIEGLPVSFKLGLLVSDGAVVQSKDPGQVGGRALEKRCHKVFLGPPCG